MVFEKEEEAPSSPSSMPASPGAQYFNSFALSVSILCVLEFEVPISIDDSQTFPLLKDVFLPINPRFSSIMSEQKENGEKVGNIFRHVGRIFSGVFDTLLDFGESIVKSGLDDDRTPIHSGTEGLEFQPKVTTKMTFSPDQLKQIKDNLNVTINDVIVGIIYLGTRTYMKVAAENNNDELGNINTKTIGLVLLNTRAIGGYKSVSEMLKKNVEMPWGNRFAFLHVPVPQLTDDESSNPLDYILKTHKMIKRKRNSSAIYFTGLLLDTMRKFRGFEWIVLVAVARGFLITIGRRPIVVFPRKIFVSLSLDCLIGIVIFCLKLVHNHKSTSRRFLDSSGPIEKISMANHPVSDFYYIVGGCPRSLGVTMVSYMGKLNVVFATEKGLIDIEKYKSCIESAFQMTLEATGHAVS
ncbi:O-acyltransferase WSD1 [Camellia lanceoleosa]|uniref:O-acyltransferase WSD1 n=1 Tax=Camellia lanceoleosa TaxID=1840588 RepID=A0ACC0H6Y0_9ERIC|nr:O-acyltransferase WSD1 [Camellia lanceoleosa]